MSLKQMALRHAGVCRRCGVELPAKSTAVYDFTAKNVICLTCRGEDLSAHLVPSRPPQVAAAPSDRRSTDRRVADRRRSAGAD